MLKHLLLVATPLALAACESNDTTIVSTGTPTPAEQACLRDVTAATGNPSVVLLGSEFSEAGTLVRVGVGSQMATWQCIAASDGTTSGIMSLADEGAM